MAYEPKPGDFSLFINDKEGNDKLPDRRGYFVAHRDIKAGERIEVAAWIKGDKAKPFLSGRISDPREKAKPGGRNDSDLPF